MMFPLFVEAVVLFVTKVLSSMPTPLGNAPFLAAAGALLMGYRLVADVVVVAGAVS